MTLVEARVNTVTDSKGGQKVWLMEMDMDACQDNHMHRNRYLTITMNNGKLYYLENLVLRMGLTLEMLF